MTEVGPWRPEDDAKLEAAYGVTMDELTAEAARGYCTQFDGTIDRARSRVEVFCGKPASYYIIWVPSAESPPSLACVEHMAEIQREIPELILTAQSLR